MKSNEEEGYLSQLPANDLLASHIIEVIKYSISPNSSQLKFSINSFQNYVNHEYKTTQDQQYFVTKLFRAITINSLGMNPLVYTIFLSALIDVNIGSKLSKATKMAREISLIPPSTDKMVFHFLDKVLIWLSNHLGTSLYTSLRVLRTQIQSWFSSGNENLIISSLFLLDIFLKRFRNLMRSSFETIKSMILRSLKSSSANVINAARKVLTSFLKLNDSDHKQVISLCNLIVEYLVDPKEIIQESFWDILNAVLKKNPEFKKLFHFKESSIFTIIDLKTTRLRLIPLIYICSPSIFRKEHFISIFNLYQSLLKKNGNKNYLYVSLGEFFFLIGNDLQNLYKNDIEQIQNIICNDNKSDEAFFATLSLISPNTSYFYSIFDSIFKRNSNSLILRGLYNFTKKWPNLGSQIREKIIPQFSLEILSHDEQPEKVIHAFSYLTYFQIPKKELSFNLLYMFSSRLDDHDISIRKQAGKFLLSQQHNFPLIKVRLLTSLLTETNDELRLSIIQQIETDDNSIDLIEPLYPLIHDRQLDLRYQALKLMCNISSATIVLSEYITELVRFLDHVRMFNKQYVYSLLIITKKRKSLVRPFSKFLMQILLKSPNQTSSSLELLSELLQFYSKKVDLSQLATIIHSNLSIHASIKRNESAINLLSSSLRYTGIRKLLINNYSIIIYRLFELSNCLDDKIHHILLNVIEQIGVININRMSNIITANKVNSSTYSILGALTLVNQKAKDNDYITQITNISVYTSISILLNILTEESLSTLHFASIESLLSILLTYHNVGEGFEKLILDKITNVISNGDDAATSMTMQNIIPLLTVFGNKLAPLLPVIIDMIRKTWKKSTIPSNLQAIRWIALRIPNEFAHYIHQIVILLLEPISGLSDETTSSIYLTIISFGPLMKQVDYLIIPSILSWLENNTSYEIKKDGLTCLKEIIIQCKSRKYCTEIIRTLLIICRQNNNLIKETVDIFIIIAIQMKQRFLIYLHEISTVIRFDEIPELQMLIQCISLGKEIPKSLSSKCDTSDKSFSKINQFSKEINMNRKLLPELKLPLDDWDVFSWCHWFDEFVPLILSSSCKAISVCSPLADRNSSVKNSLFPIAYAFIYASEQQNLHIKHILITSLMQQCVPNYIIRPFLIVIEYLEMIEIEIPIRNWNILAEKALNAGQYAQALRYYEYVFNPYSQESIENLISLNLQLGLTLSASGILKVSTIGNCESLSQKLGLWEDAYDSYCKVNENDANYQQALNGKMKCLEALSKYKDLYQLTMNDSSIYSASAAFHLMEFERLSSIVDKLDKQNIESLFYKIINFVYVNDFENAEKLIELINAEYIPQLFPMIFEDYEKCYDTLFGAALISEIKDIIFIKKIETKRDSADSNERDYYDNQVKKIYNEWNLRFQQLEDSTKLMYETICVRSLLLNKNQMGKYWIKFLQKEAEKGKTQLGEIALSYVNQDYPEVQFSQSLMLWNSNNQEKAIEKLTSVVKGLPKTSKLLPKFLTVLGNWHMERLEYEDVFNYFSKVTTLASKSSENWGNLAKVTLLLSQKYNSVEYSYQSLRANINGLINGPSNPISFTLQTFTILSQNNSKDFCKLLSSNLVNISSRVWLFLLPQIVAKVSHPELNGIFKELLLQISISYTQKVLYSLLVNLKSDIPDVSSLTSQIVDLLRFRNPKLVNQVLLFARELLRLAGFYFEVWNTAIDNTSKQYVLHGNLNATIEELIPLHKLLENPPETLYEVSFKSNFGDKLNVAKEYINEYIKTKNIIYYHQAWSIYVEVFKKTRLIMNNISNFQLSDGSPLLAELKNTELIVPGNEDVFISSISDHVQIINSKQKPRKINVIGSNGKIYPFLLKANEDTRLDERVMQLFNYISDFISQSKIPLSSKLNITTYSVVPLTNKVGLIGWVQDTKTLHDVIQNFRISHGKPIDIEYRKTMKVCPEYETTTIENKEKAFLYGINKTDGNELKQVLLKFSTDSNDWLARRVQFTTSLAVTSMAGYILGLGDRHLCNIMIKNRTAKLVHIDFGDCFEIAMKRARFPEKVPFRLTRVFLNALEVSKIEGTLRLCCENVMQLLRNNEEQIIALLRAFITDPLLQWASFKSNNKPIEILERIKNKLTGNDFNKNESLTVKEQVKKLIDEATSTKNLCQMFRGWCAWW